MGGRKCLFGFPAKSPCLVCPIFYFSSLSPDSSATKGNSPSVRKSGWGLSGQERGRQASQLVPLLLQQTEERPGRRKGPLGARKTKAILPTAQQRQRWPHPAAAFLEEPRAQEAPTCPKDETDLRQTSPAAQQGSNLLQFLGRLILTKALADNSASILQMLRDLSSLA